MPRFLQRHDSDKNTFKAFQRAVMDNNISSAESRLKINPDFAHQQGTYVALRGKQHLEHFSAFQYAVWSLNLPMYQMLRQYIPDVIQAQQLSAGNTQGDYVDFDLLISALKTYTMNYDTWSDEQRKSFWLGDVCTAQELLPEHFQSTYFLIAYASNPEEGMTKKTLPFSDAIANALFGARLEGSSTAIEPNQLDVQGTITFLNGLKNKFVISLNESNWTLMPSC